MLCRDVSQRLSLFLVGQGESLLLDHFLDLRPRGNLVYLTPPFEPAKESVQGVHDILSVFCGAGKVVIEELQVLEPNLSYVPPAEVLRCLVIFSRIGLIISKGGKG